MDNVTLGAAIAIAKNNSGGGGGGGAGVSIIPYRVIDFETMTVTCDYTFNEIKGLYDSGAFLVAAMSTPGGTNFFPPLLVDSGSIIFHSVMVDEFNSVSERQIQHNSDNSIQLSTLMYP